MYLASLRSLRLCVRLFVFVASLHATVLHAAPDGFRTSTIPLNAPPSGLAFDDAGVLYALETAEFGDNSATLRTIFSDGAFGTDASVVGDDPENLFVGGMAFDPLTSRVLVSDNTADGRIYAIDPATGNQETIANGVAAIADLAVRSTGEIFATTALGDDLGELLTIDRTTGAATTVLAGLDFGAGIDFDAAGDLYVQDSDATTFAGRVQRLPITESPGGLSFGQAEVVADGMQSAAGLIVDGDGDVFTTGVGGLFRITEMTATEAPFETTGAAGQFATAIAFDAGAAPFEPFAGPGGGRLAYTANFADQFVTIIEPARAENADFNNDDLVNELDLTVWMQNFGTLNNALLSTGDANSDGAVVGGDFLIWQRQTGETTAIANVPEPASLALSASFLAYLWANRKRRVW